MEVLWEVDDVLASEVTSGQTLDRVGSKFTFLKSFWNNLSFSVMRQRHEGGIMDSINL